MEGIITSFQGIQRKLFAGRGMGSGITAEFNGMDKRKNEIKRLQILLPQRLLACALDGEL
jgi:hypothetical protein